MVIRETKKGFIINFGIYAASRWSAEAAADYVQREVLKARKRFDGPVDREEQSRRDLIYQDPAR